MAFRLDESFRCELGKPGDKDYDGLVTGVTMVPQEIVLPQSWLLEDLGVEAFGAEDAVAGFKEEIELRLGDRPVARSVRSLYKLAEKELPPSLGGLKGDIYVVAHNIGATAKKQAGRIESLEFRATFEGEGTTIDLVPSTRFKEFFKGELGLDFEASVSADGYANVPEAVGNLLPTQIVNFGGGAKLELSSEASVVGKLSFSLVTPKVQAVGQSSSIASWQIDKDDKPLVGDQVLMQTILVPKGQETVNFTLQGFATIDPSWRSRPVPIQTKPVEVAVDLD